MTRFPTVSVIVPCFNEAPEIVAQSLKSLMLQTFIDFECIVVDESTDPKRAEACRTYCQSDPRFIYEHPKDRLGLAGSLNYGIKLSRGTYIARFDSDDICDQSRIEKQVNFLDNNHDIGIVGSSMQIIDSIGKILAVRTYPSGHRDIERLFVYSNSMAHPTVMFRKSLINDENGPYRNDFRFSEDLELWLRLLSKGVLFANLPEILVSYRQDSFYRPVANWQFNVKARRMYMTSGPYRVRKALVVCLLSMWAALPKYFQSYVYKKIVFRRYE